MNNHKLEKIINGIVSDAIVKEVMSLDLAVKLIQTVEEKAKDMGLAVVVAVSDASGRPIAVHCMDGAYHGSFDVAVKKAYTAVSVKMSTMELGKLVQPGQTFAGLEQIESDKLVFFGGGVPLFVGDNLVGGLGISGGTGEEDDDIAQYALSVFEECCR